MAQLLEHGLLRGGFVPPVPIRESRDLTRYRKTIVQERTRAIDRLNKVLEDADTQLASGPHRCARVSGRAMLEALVAGTTDPDTLAELARGALRNRKKLRTRRQALSGRFHPHHAFCAPRSWRISRLCRGMSREAVEQPRPPLRAGCAP